VMIMAPLKDLPNISDKARCFVAGGNGGKGGDAAPGGSPGRGGDGGDGSFPYCKDESERRRASNGDRGADGTRGADGHAGAEGNMVAVPITADAFEARLKGGPS
jgi:hypothetical protein